MNHSLPVESICDSEAARLLPWFVNGRLSAEEGERVGRHLQECAVCRADLEEQRDLRAAMRDDGPVEYAPQAGLEKTLARIDELARIETDPLLGVEAAPEFPPSRRFGVTQWLTAAVVVQAIGLGTLAGVLMTRNPAKSDQLGYQTLSSPAPVAAGPAIRAVFAAPMTVGELKSLLTAQHLLIVAGPTDAGVFTLGAADAPLSADRLDASLSGLRASPHVLFAEPVNAVAVKSP